MSFQSLFFCRPLAWAFIFILVQQSIVASSTWFLSQVTTRINEPAQILSWLLGFVLCLALPYLPGVVALRKIAMVKNLAQLRILERLRTVIEGRSTLLSHQGEREKRFVFLQREGEDFVTQACDAGFDFTQTLFNVLLNIVSLVMVVHTALLPTYALSLILMIAAVRIGREPLTTATRQLRTARVNFENTRLKTWENLTIGNTLNTQRWNSSLAHQYQDFAKKRIHLLTIREVTSLISTWAAMVPVLAANVWMIYKAHSGPEIALLVATLPRQLMVLNHIHILSSHSGLWHELRERFAGLQEALTDITPSVLQEHEVRIDFSKIGLEAVEDGGKNLQSDTRFPRAKHSSDFVNWAQTKPQGRFRVKGNNGAGKSTLLRSLKETLGPDAFYLPAEHQALDFPVADGLSSGQRARSILECLQNPENQPPRVILLDEWDANLDTHHRMLLDSLIARLGEKHLVLEVRHH